VNTLQADLDACGSRERDAGEACEARATERKLFGAARASFTKRCVGDAVGT
jgi:hypothetical protein